MQALPAEILAEILSSLKEEEWVRFALMFKKARKVVDDAKIKNPHWDAFRKDVDDYRMSKAVYTNQREDFMKTIAKFRQYTGYSPVNIRNTIGYIRDEATGKLKVYIRTADTNSSRLPKYDEKYRYMRCGFEDPDVCNENWWIRYYLVKLVIRFGDAYSRFPMTSHFLYLAWISELFTATGSTEYMSDPPDNVNIYRLKGRKDKKHVKRRRMIK
jgi:hypothetical protein